MNRQTIKQEIETLAEQINNETMESAWVIGLGWSHAMFIDVLNKLYNLE